MSVFVGVGNSGTEAKSDRLGVPTLPSDPGTGESGDMYFNTTVNKLKYYDGTAWTEITVTVQSVEATGGTIGEYVTAPGSVYRSHTFTSSGQFEFTQTSDSITDFQYLIVGGGGGGGGKHYPGTGQFSGGGGGGGAVRVGTYPIVINTPYNITIGAGGLYERGGTDTTFAIPSSTVASGGGAGGS